MAVATLESLPEELLLAVLERVEGRGLATMAAVSRMWRRLATDQRFHLKVDSSMTPEDILGRLADLPALRAVTMQVTNGLLPAMAEHPSLESVHLLEGEGRLICWSELYHLLYSGKVEGILPGNQVLRNERWRGADCKLFWADGRWFRKTPLKLCLAHSTRMAGVVRDICALVNRNR